VRRNLIAVLTALAVVSATMTPGAMAFGDGGAGPGDGFGGGNHLGGSHPGGGLGRSGLDHFESYPSGGFTRGYGHGYRAYPGYYDGGVRRFGLGLGMGLRGSGGPFCSPFYNGPYGRC
jgi:hypothetical protein